MALTTGSSAGDQPPTRYLITFAYIPDEATWCTSASFAAAVQKAKRLWEITDCAFVYYLTTHTGKATAVKITCADDFTLWYRGGDPVTHKLVAHDRTKALRVTHSSGLSQLSHRPVLDTTVLSDLGAAYLIKHSGQDEVVLFGLDEPGVWGRAVQKAQATWSVHRPLFRYVDEVNGERVVVSIIDANDFSMWHKHRRPLLPELTVFEHAAPQLLDGPVAYAAFDPKKESAPETTQPTPVSEAQEPAKAEPGVSRAPYVHPPKLTNAASAAKLHEAATGRPPKRDDAVPKTPAEVEYQHMLELLVRRDDVAAMVKKPQRNRAAEDAATAAAASRGPSQDGGADTDAGDASARSNREML